MMLSMFKDKKGFDVLFGSSARNSSLLSLSTSSVSDVPVLKESLPHVTSSSTSSTTLQHNDQPTNWNLTNDNDTNKDNKMNSMEFNNRSRVTLTQRCQRCWRNFFVVEDISVNDPAYQKENLSMLSSYTQNNNNNCNTINNHRPAALDKSAHAHYNVLEFTCCMCDHTICPRCRVYNPQNDSNNNKVQLNTWRCCSCVKSMTLMRLFDDTLYGSELVVRVIDFCDLRAARIMRSFFHSAARVLASQRNKRQQRLLINDSLNNDNNNSSVEREGSLIRTSYATAWLEHWKCKNAQVIHADEQNEENNDSLRNNENDERELCEHEQEYKEKVLLESENKESCLHGQQETFKEITGKADTLAVGEADTHSFQHYHHQEKQQEVQHYYVNALLVDKDECNTNKTGIKLRVRSANEVNALDCKSQWHEKKEKPDKITADKEKEIKINDDIQDVENYKGTTSTTSNSIISKEQKAKHQYALAAVVKEQKQEDEEMCEANKRIASDSRSSSPVLFMAHTSPTATNPTNTEKEIKKEVKANGFVRSEPVRLSLLAYDDNINNNNNSNIVMNDKIITNNNINKANVDDITSNNEEEAMDDRSCSPPPRFPPFSEVVNECLKVTEVEVNLHKTKSRKRFAQNEEQCHQLNSNNIKSKRSFSNSNKINPTTGVYNVHKQQRKSKSYRKLSSANQANNNDTFCYSYNNNDYEDDDDDNYSFVSLSPESEFDEPMVCDANEDDTDNSNNNYENDHDDVISYSDEHVTEHTSIDKSNNSTNNRRNSTFKDESEGKHKCLSSPHTTLRLSKSIRVSRQLRKSKPDSFKKNYNKINDREAHECEVGMSKSSKSDNVSNMKSGINNNKSVKENNNGVCTSYKSKTCKENIVCKPNTDNTEEISLHKNLFGSAKDANIDIVQSHREQTASTSTFASLSHKTHSKISSKQENTAGHSGHREHIAPASGDSNHRMHHVLTYHTPVKSSLLNSVTRLTEAHRRTSHRHERHHGQRSSSAASSSMISSSSSSWLLSHKGKTCKNKKNKTEHFVEYTTPKSARQHSQQLHKETYRQALHNEKEAKYVATMQSTRNRNESIHSANKDKMSTTQTPKVYTQNERQTANINRSYMRTASYAHFTRKPSTLASLLPNNKYNSSNNNNKLKRTHSALPFTSTSMYCHPYSQLELTKNVKSTYPRNEERQQEENKKLVEHHLDTTPSKDKSAHALSQMHTCTVTPLRQFSRTSSTRTRTSNTAKQTTPHFTNPTRFAPQLNGSLQKKNTTTTTIINTHNAYSLCQPQSSRFASRAQKVTREEELSTPPSSSSVVSVNNRDTNKHKSTVSSSSAVGAANNSDGVVSTHKVDNLFSRSHTATTITSRNRWEHNSVNSTNSTNKDGKIVVIPKTATRVASARLNGNNQRECKMIQQRCLQQHREATSSTSSNYGAHRLYRSRSAITSLTRKAALSSTNDNKNTTITTNSNPNANVKQDVPDTEHNSEHNVSAMKKFNCNNSNKENNCINVSARLRRLGSSYSSTISCTQHQETLAKTNVDHGKEKSFASVVTTNTAASLHDKETNTHTSPVVPFTRKLENLKRSCSSRHALSSRPIFTRHESTHTPIRMNALSARSQDTKAKTNTSDVNGKTNDKNSVSVMGSSVHKSSSKTIDSTTTPFRNFISSIKSNTFYRTSSRTLLTQQIHNTKQGNANVGSEQEQQQQTNSNTVNTNMNDFNNKNKAPVISPLLTVTRKNAISARDTAKVNANKSLFSHRHNNSNSSNNNNSSSSKNQLVKRTLQRSELPTSRSANANKSSTTKNNSALLSSASSSSSSSCNTTSSTVIKVNTALAESLSDSLSSRQHSASLLSSQNRLTSLNLTGRRSGTRPVLNSAASTPRNTSDTDCNNVNDNFMGDVTITHVNLTERLRSGESEVNV